MDFEHPEELIGKRLAGRFRVEKVLGAGGMGVVLQARHEGLGASVAIKVLKQSMRPEARARFRREASIAAKLSGEHVVRVTDLGALPDGTPFLVMELVGGKTLADALHADGPLPVEQAAMRVIEACEALAEAHAHGIVHRDLKPSNLLLAVRADGRVVLKVADFGVAKIEEADASVLTHDDSAIGSPSYMSPEQIDDPRTVDGRSDLFSLGVVLFELLSGTRPFDARSVSGTLTRVAAHDPPDLIGLRRDIPEALAGVVRHALSKQAGERYQTAAAFAAALAPFAGPDGHEAAARVARTSARPTLGAETIGLAARGQPREPTTMTEAGVLGTRTGPASPATRSRWLVALAATLFVGSLAGWMTRESRAPAPAASAPAPPVTASATAASTVVEAAAPTTSTAPAQSAVEPPKAVPEKPKSAPPKAKSAGSARLSETPAAPTTNGATTEIDGLGPRK